MLLLYSSLTHASSASENTNVILEVSPVTYTATTVNEEFTISINAKNVLDLFGWELKITYDTLLVVQDVRINVKFYNISCERVDNYFLIAGTLLRGDAPLNGDVTLVQMAFEAPVQGEYAFDLYDTKLVNSNLEPIPHQIVDGVPNVTHDVALLGLVSDPSGWIPVPRGDPVYIEVTVKNNGNFSETFPLYVYADQNVTVLFDELVVAQATVSVEAGELLTVNLVWDTTNAPYGSYYISAEADLEDDDMTNNFIEAASFVGGICHRWEPPKMDYTPFLIALASSATIIGLLAAAMIAIFKVLAMIRMPLLTKRIKP